MLWTDSFKSRVLFNASKAYVRQIEKGQQYKGLEPVYSLSLVNENFEPNSTNYFHHYKIIHSQDSNLILKGLELVFIELPKFKAQNFTDRKLSVLWLRFLAETKDGQENMPEEFSEDQNIRKAVELLKESSYSKLELEAYDRYWDSISSEKTLIFGAFDEGKLEGKLEGRLEGRLEVAKSLKEAVGP
jgi:predicted transposase/invertase (TIGR01784 family)